MAQQVVLCFQWFTLNFSYLIYLILIIGIINLTKFVIMSASFIDLSKWFTLELQQII